MIFFLHDLVCQSSRAHHNAGKGIEQLTTEHNAAHSSPTEAQRIASGIDLWHDFAKEQQQERQQDRYTQEFQPPCSSKIDGMVEEISKQHDDCDIDQIVGDKYGGQGTFRLLTQLLYLRISIRLGLVQVIQVSRRQ